MRKLIKSSLSRTGDLMTGDLRLSVDDNTDDNYTNRVIGSTDLVPNRSFSVALGDKLNRLYLILTAPVTLETTRGFLVQVSGADVCQIGTSDSPAVILVLNDIRVNLNRITNLPEPAYPHEEATKTYADNNSRKILSGYFPTLRSF